MPPVRTEGRAKVYKTVRYPIDCNRTAVVTPETPPPMMAIARPDRGCIVRPLTAIGTD